MKKKLLLEKVAEGLNLAEDHFILVDLGSTKPIDLDVLGKSLPILAESLLVS